MNPPLPDGLPPLPPNTYYGGRLKDHRGDIAGYCLAEGEEEWTHYDDAWRGMKDHPNAATADWHIALPLPEEDAKTEGEDPRFLMINRDLTGIQNSAEGWPTEESQIALSEIRKDLAESRAEEKKWRGLLAISIENTVALREENKRLREEREWHRGPANGGGGTAQDRCPEGRTSWWWDGDQLEVVFDLVDGPVRMMVNIYADGDDTGMTVSGTDEDPGYDLSDIAWWRKAGPLPAAPENQGEGGEG